MSRSIELRNGKVMSELKLSKLIAEEDAALLANFMENQDGKLDISAAQELIKSRKIATLARNL